MAGSGCSLMTVGLAVVGVLVREGGGQNRKANGRNNQWCL